MTIRVVAAPIEHYGPMLAAQIVDDLAQLVHVRDLGADRMNDGKDGKREKHRDGGWRPHSHSQMWMTLSYWSRQ